MSTLPAIATRLQVAVFFVGALKAASMQAEFTPTTRYETHKNGLFPNQDLKFSKDNTKEFWEYTKGP